MNRTLLRYVLVAALGGLLFGFDTAVINGALPFFADYFDLNETMRGWSVSSALAGCIVGAILVGKPGDIFGRRSVLRFLALLYLISALGTGLATHFNVFIIFRFIGGLAVGGSSVLSPMYIAEISPPEFRGRLTVTFQLAIVIGILIAFFSDYLLINTGEYNWRWMFLAEALPAIFFMVLLYTVEKSPRWLVKNGNVEKAKQVITKVNPGIEAEKCVQDIKSSINEEIVGKSIYLFRKPYLKLVFTGIFVGMFNQFTGINIIMYYATDIFRSAGFSTNSAIGQTVVIGAVNLIFTLLAMLIIDKVGRKKLLLTGALGMALFLFFFSLASIFHVKGSFILLIMLMGYTGFFAASQGAVIWVLLAEMFPNNIRARGSSIGSFSHWFFNGLTSLIFPVIMGAFTGTVGIGIIFLFYASMTLMSYFYFKKYIVETKGKSLEALELEIIKK